MDPAARHCRVSMRWAEHEPETCLALPSLSRRVECSSLTLIPMVGLLPLDKYIHSRP